MSTSEPLCVIETPKCSRHLIVVRQSSAELKFSRRPVTRQDLGRVTTAVRKLEETRRAAELFRSHPDFDFATENLGWVVELLSPLNSIEYSEAGPTDNSIP